MIGSQDDTGGKAGQEVFRSTSPLGESELAGQLWGQTRLLRAVPCQGSEISKDGARTALLGTCAPVQPCPPRGMGLLISVLNLSSFSFILLLFTAVKSPAPTPQSLPCRCWRMLWAPPSPLLISFPGWIGPAPAASPHGASAPALWASWGPSAELARLSVPFLSWGPQTGCSILDMP